MKKSSTFILILSFLLSIFMVSIFGLEIRDEHMKRYFKKVEIINTEVIESPDMGIKEKLIYLQITPDDLPYSHYIDYVVLPEDVTDSDGYEFVITGGLYGDVVEYGGEEHEYAEMTKNRVDFYHECDITVMLRTTDGSGKQDSVIIICEFLPEE